MTKHVGFSLIEIIVAIAILGIVSTAVLTFLPSVTNVNQNTKTDQDITIVAKRFMEEVRAAWLDGTNGQIYFDSGTLSDGTTAVDTYQPNYSTDAPNCTASVSDPDAGTYTPIQRKQVSLSCTEDDGTSTTFTLEFGRPK